MNAPRDYSKLLSALMEHGSLRRACRELEITRSVFLEDVDASPALADQYAHARATGLDAVMEDIRDAPITDPAADRLDWDRKRWHASKLFARKYGDKVDDNHSGNVAVTSIVRRIVDPSGA